jgi:hypothetical protein
MVCLLIKYEADLTLPSSETQDEISTRRQRRIQPLKTMWFFWSEKTDHVPSSELSGVHFHIKLFPMNILPTSKSQRLKRIWMTAGQNKSNMAHYAIYFTLFATPWAEIAQSVWQLATGWMVQGSNPSGGECQIFHTRPDQPWGPLSPLYNGYWVFPGGKTAGVWRVDHPPASSNKVKERAELYLYSTSGSSLHVLVWTLPLP